MIHECPNCKRLYTFPISDLCPICMQENRAKVAQKKNGNAHDFGRKIYFSDDLEFLVAKFLHQKGIKFIHESESNGDFTLDFYLPDFDVYIEVKRYHSDRINRQLKAEGNIILLQSKEAVNFLCSFL